MQIKIVAKPVFWFAPGPEIVAVLIKMAELHYDGECKSASKVGGFLFGWRNATSFDPSTGVSSEWRELDVALKICENWTFLPTDEAAKALTFSKEIRTAMQKSIDEFHHILFTVGV